jgi:hypothetical protein
MIGILSVLSLGFFEKFAMLFATKQKEYQEIKIINNFFIMSFIFFIYSFLYYENLDFSFFYDRLFYLTIFAENAILFIALKNYNQQNSFTEISFAAFSTLYLIVFLSYFYNYVFDLDTVMKSPYSTLSETLFYSFVFFILTILYFYDKLLSNKIKHPFLLFLFAIFLANGMFMAVSALQKFQGTLVYSFIFLTMIIQQLYWYQKKHSFKDLYSNISFSNSFEQKEHLKNQFLYTFFFLMTWILSIIGAFFLKVEFFAIFKRTGAIFGAMIIDKYISKKNVVLLLKDVIILLIILFIGVYLTFVKN